MGVREKVLGLFLAQVISLIVFNSDDEGKDDWSQNTDTQYDDRTDEDTTQIKDGKEER